MRQNPTMIVMLTQNDKTVMNAHDVFEQNRDSKAKFWGFKEKPLSLEKMKALYAYMKKCGKTTFLEVVEYEESACVQGALQAVACGCDILMGTTYFDSVRDICRENDIKYMPFVGKVSGRPSILEGDVRDMIAEANAYLQKGVYGFDLLGYRYTGDAYNLIKKFTSNVNAPVCVTGSINTYNRLDQLKEVQPWAFTVGTAFFENKFDGTFTEQINKVCDYMWAE